MRASEQEQKGGAGSNEVAANFERIGWGPAENSKHDLGTDLFLMARDRRLIDLGMVVGAQVKAGPDYFKEERKDKTGAVVGWTFRDSRAHFDYWLAHQLPHLVVLHDWDTRISYWAHVTKATVEYTNKAAKIIIPAENTVDAAHADALLDVAASKAARVEWEGSAWTGAARLSPSDQLRHAVLTPRLVAPHPNQRSGIEISAAQAIAMLVQVRIQDLENFSSQDAGMPNLESLDSAAPWDWRLASALRSFLFEGDPEVFASVVSTAVMPHEQAVARILYASALLEDASPQLAQDVLVTLLSEDKLDLVDHAWAQVQHARTLIELGRLEQARNEVLPLVGFGARAHADVTAGAVAGAAANLVFAASDWGSQDLAGTIAAADTTASWWRQQVVSWGLAAQAQRSFRQWASDTSISIISNDTAWQHLRSASLMAGFLGEHGAWRRSCVQLGTYMLADAEHGANPDHVKEALTTLRRAGDHTLVKLATRRVVHNGPAAAAKAAAELVHPEASTRTTARADLFMLIESAELLEQDQADSIAEWAMRVLNDADEYVQRVHPSFLVDYDLVDLLKALVIVVGDTTQDKIADFVLTLPAVSDQGYANRLGPLVSRLPDRVWSAARTRQAAERADADNWELTYPLLAAASPHKPDVRQRLVTEAASGSLPALSALGDVRDLDTQVVASIVSTLAEKVDAQIEQARHGMHGLGGHNLGHSLAVLNVWHPKEANWDVMYRLLGSTVFDPHLAGALTVLAGSADRLTDDVAERLRPLAESIADRPRTDQRALRLADASTPARQLLAALDRRSGESARTQLAALAKGDTDARQAAAIQARDPSDAAGLGVLIVLAGDVEPRVRATAAAIIADRAAHGDAAAQAQLTHLAQDPGVLVPRALAEVAAKETVLQQAEELGALATHPSARVRRVFARHAKRTTAAGASTPGSEPDQSEESMS